MHNAFMLVNFTPDDKSIGITKKISAQIRALQNLGYNVYYTGYTKNGVAVFDNSGNIVETKLFRTKNEKINGLIRYSTLLKCADKFIESAGLSFDLCYGRISAPTGRYIRFLNKLHSSGTKVIIEALSYFPGVKPKTLKSKYIAFFLDINQNKLKKVIDKFITEGKVDNFYGIPTEKGLIGVETDLLPKHVYTGSIDELNLISVATEREYHAYDRLIKSLYEYKKRKGKRKIVIHLVGKLYDSTVNLIKDCGLENDVIMYGKVVGNDLYAIYNKCNMGVGPLGQHRVGGKKDTGLKTKEYFGIGLPYFYSGIEEDIPKDFPYIYEVKSDESIIDLDEIWDFYQSFAQDETAADVMRNYAKKTFSWNEIMKKAITLDSETAVKL